MSETSFNYATPAFRQHAEHPGFWDYALTIPSDTSRFEMRMDNVTLQSMPDRLLEDVEFEFAGEERLDAVEIDA